MEGEGGFGIPGHRGISYFTGLMFISVFIVGLYFDVGFLPLFLPSLGILFCWFRHFKKIPLDGALFIYFMGFLGFGFVTVMFQLVISITLGMIFPHDVTLSTKYAVSNLLYSILGGSISTEFSGFLPVYQAGGAVA
jgi:hypothetical protein